MTKVGRKSIHGYWRHRGNIVLDALMHGNTRKHSLGCTDARKHGQRRAKHIAQAAEV